MLRFGKWRRREMKSRKIKVIGKPQSVKIHILLEENYSILGLNLRVHKTGGKKTK